MGQVTCAAADNFGRNIWCLYVMMGLSFHAIRRVSWVHTVLHRGTRSRSDSFCGVWWRETNIGVRMNA